MSRARRLASVVVLALTAVGTMAGWSIARGHQTHTDDPLDPARWSCQSPAIHEALWTVSEDESRCTPVLNSHLTCTGGARWFAYRFPWLMPGAFSPPVGRDPWGRPFRVLCYGTYTRVESPGPDGLAGNDDDETVICSRNREGQIEDDPGHLEFPHETLHWLDAFQLQTHGNRCAMPDELPTPTPVLTCTNFLLNP